MNSQEVVDFVRYRLTSNNPEEAEEKDEVQLSKICEEVKYDTTCNVVMMYVFNFRYDVDFDLNSKPIERIA